MSGVPPGSKIYHITHLDNLPGILVDGAVLCDRAMMDRGGPAAAIGMGSIKLRRIQELEVTRHPGTRVGDYVPFYFCPRSVMLYVIHCANHPELTYRGGQGPILHLEADLDAVTRWAESAGVKWAFSRSNAGAFYVEFGSDREGLAELDWRAIAATDFRTAEVKERKQAEFLLHGRFPFELVERIGVHSDAVGRHALAALRGNPHLPVVEVCKDWYY